MKSPIDDLLRRRPVWEALSTIFLDIAMEDAICQGIADVLYHSGYCDAELDQILWHELCPVLTSNLLSPAGEWATFDMDRIEKQIVSHPAGALRRWWACLVARRMVRDDWRHIKELIAVRRQLVRG